MDGMIGFFEFGMAREVPEWRPFNSSLPVLHLGPGEKHIPGTIELEWPAWNAECDRIPFEDGSVGGVIATHFLEHLADPRHALREIARVLAPGAPFNNLVPHAQYPMYLQDLDHKTPFVLDTWKNLLDSSFYTKGKDDLGLEIGANMMMAIKEGNVAVVTQLIKK